MSVLGSLTCGGNAMACVFGWSRRSTTRRAGSTLVATLMVAALVPLGRVDGAMAQGACAPASPVNNATVTCTGSTNGQNGTIGYGTTTDTGNAITVMPGASVTGSTAGIAFDA